ncbi:hypothetical protein KFE25_011155 [Diacronema lutheri]|uniref:Uncharacterized protein n=2 Tax=Diacronema lutheri TaxID=2081491 RepID=A0A8J5XAW9_DIALT|nr:hypothetical protein KFE25_011155 [Diacronema lutheri]
MADARHANGAQMRRRDETAVLDYLPRMTPRTYSAMMAWVMCIYLLLFAVPPATPPEAMHRYREYMTAAAHDPVAAQIEAEVAQLIRQRQEHEVLFYSWREPYKSRVAAVQAQIDERMPELEQVNAERERLRLKARKTVGLWSEIGAADVRRLFWQSWQEGKDFAKRMTFYDILFATTSRREETVVAVMLRWLLQFLMNLSVGLLTAVVWFAFRAISLVFSYQPPVLSGVAFAAVSVIGAAGAVLLFLALCYSAAVGGVYLVARQAAHARLEAQQRQQYLRAQQAQGGRAHYD